MDRVRARPDRPVHDRSLNWLRSEFYLNEDGKVVECRVPFPCDACGAEEACYGKNGALLCAGCWVKPTTGKD